MSVRQRFRQWLFRHQKSEASPVILSQRRIYILPTRSGLLYGLVLLLMYSGAINYNLGLGHALVFLLAGLGIVGLLHTFRNVYGLRLSTGPTTPVFVGERAEFMVRIESPDNRPRPAIVLQNKAGCAAMGDIPSSSEKNFYLYIEASQRGWQELGQLKLRCSYPLGLFQAWAYPAPASRCLVYPKPIFLDLPCTTPSSQQGLMQQQIGDEDFAGFRLRHPGDSIKHAAWKAYARDPEHRPLQVKVFSGGQQVQLHFCWSDLAPGLRTEDRLSILCGWIIQAEKMGYSFKLSLPSQGLPLDNGPHHATRCLELLALFPFERDAHVV